MALSTKKHQSTNGFLMPNWSPPFGPPPYPMLMAELLMVEFEADREEIERITPPPFEAADHNRLIAFVGDNSQLSHSLAYHEAAILQPVVYKGRTAITVPYIWTSTDTALIAGREIYGMPKLICDDGELRRHANSVAGTLERDGRRMMSLSMTIDRQGSMADLPFGADWAFMRHIPSPDPDWPSLRQLVWVTLEDFNMQECWMGKGWLEMGDPGSSGLDRLKPRSITNAWYGKFQWSLGWGKILMEEKIDSAIKVPGQVGLVDA
ncbi:MAG: acetoacetate decarboxylase family protein [Alphaproteobacteria bacterium]